MTSGRRHFGHALCRIHRLRACYHVLDPNTSELVADEARRGSAACELLGYAHVAPPCVSTASAPAPCARGPTSCSSGSSLNPRSNRSGWPRPRRVSAPLVLCFLLLEHHVHEVAPARTLHTGSFLIDRQPCSSRGAPVLGLGKEGEWLAGLAPSREERGEVTRSDQVP